MRKTVFHFLFFVGVSFLFISCDPNRVYEKDMAIKDAVWHRENKATFTINIEDTVSRYNIYLNFRHAGNYNYRNLYLFSTIIGPSKLAAQDTAQMILADTRGNWNGKGIGDLYDYTFLFKKNVIFPRKGEYKIQLEQGMRDEKLKYVTDVGLRIEKVVQ